MTKRVKQYQLPSMSLWNKILFFEQFRTYMSSSLPITTALHDLKKYSNNAQIKNIANILLRELDRGNSFHDVILKFKIALGGTYCNLMALGAQSGNLPRILNDIYDSLKRQRTLIFTIIKQSAYPAFLFFVMLLPAVATLFQFIVPRMVKWHRNTYGQVPSNLAALQDINVLITANIVPLIIISLIIVWLLTLFFRNIFTSRFGAQFPILGNLVRYYNLSQFTKLLAIGYSAGIPITHTLMLAAEALPNKYIQSILYRCSSLVTRHPLTETFATTRLFDPNMLTKIRTGEQTGELDKLLHEISNDLEERLETTITAILKVIEPILLLIMAILIVMYGTTIMSTIFAI